MSGLGGCVCVGLQFWVMGGFCAFLCEFVPRGLWSLDKAGHVAADKLFGAEAWRKCRSDSARFPFSLSSTPPPLPTIYRHGCVGRKATRRGLATGKIRDGSTLPRKEGSIAIERHTPSCYALERTISLQRTARFRTKFSIFEALVRGVLSGD